MATRTNKLLDFFLFDSLAGRTMFLSHRIVTPNIKKMYQQIFSFDISQAYTVIERKEETRANK